MSLVKELEDDQNLLRSSLETQKSKLTTAVAHKEAKEKEAEDKKRQLTESREEVVRERAKFSLMREDYSQVRRFC